MIRPGLRRVGSVAGIVIGAFLSHSFNSHTACKAISEMLVVVGVKTVR